MQYKLKGVALRLGNQSTYACQSGTHMMKLFKRSINSNSSQQKILLFQQNMLFTSIKLPFGWHDKAGGLRRAGWEPCLPTLHFLPALLTFRNSFLWDKTNPLFDLESACRSFDVLKYSTEIYDPVDVRISVSNKRQVWWRGPHSPVPPPGSATG